jgi:hypothetical protein
MTVKQILIGSLLGASAIGLMLHRLPKFSAAGFKAATKSEIKSASRGTPRPSSTRSVG